VNESGNISPEQAAAYVQHLTGCQNQLYGYIYSLLRNAEAAWDVLQETNVVLWRKAADYDTERPFLPWALGVAFNQVRAARTRLGRDKLMFHEDSTLEVLSADWRADAADQLPADVEIAMDGCLARLPAKHREVVERHYKGGESLGMIAKTLNRTANAVGVMLHRIRLALAQCMDKALDRQPARDEPRDA
jgi:RNA polymerase sigma-70 factor, ECF subfamily